MKALISWRKCILNLHNMPRNDTICEEGVLGDDIFFLYKYIQSYYPILFYCIHYKLRTGASFHLCALVLINTTCNLVTNENTNKTVMSTRLI